MRQTTHAIVLFSMLVVATQLNAATYYISPTGSDSANGTTTTSAWKTIVKVNNTRFAAGDRIMFQAGQTFTGKLYFDSADAGTAANPIVIGSYGTGRATINAGGTDDAFFAYNVAAFTISNLNFIGSGSATSNGGGIVFYNELAGTKLDHIHIDSVEVSGFQKGINIGGWNLGGFRSVRITNCVAHDCRRGGISTYTQAKGDTEDVYVGHCKAYNISGEAAFGPYSTGSPIVLGGVNGGTVERCVVYNSGWLCDADSGPVGIWCYESNAITVQFNEAYRIQAVRVDGDGFDFDGGTTNSLMQYNYSHENDGAGFLLCEYSGASAWDGNTVRYNISQNDCRRRSYGAIHFYCAPGMTLRNCDIYNNTVYVTPASGNIPRAVYVYTGCSNIRIRNNILATTGGVTLVETPLTQTNIVFQNNNYWSSGSAFVIKNSVAYSSLSAWRTATGQETLNALPLGLSVDPKFAAAGAGGTIGNADQLETLSAYKLLADSPMKNTGLNLSTTFAINPGTRDYNGTALPQGGAYDLGCHEVPVSSGTPPTISDIADRTINEDTTTGAIAFTVADAETPATSLSVSVSSSNITLVPLSGIVLGGSGSLRTVSVAPAANKFGTATITISISDGSLSTSDSFILTVSAVNDVPLASNQSVSTNEDTAKAIVLTATDADGNLLTYTIVTGPAKGTLGGTPPNLIYTPQANYSGADSLTFKANDGIVDSNVATVSITVNAANDLPNVSLTAPANAATYTAPATISMSASASDVDGTIAKVEFYQGTTLLGTSTTVPYGFTWNSVPAGNYTLTAKAYDNLAAVRTSTAVVVTVRSLTNSAPVANNQSVTTNEDTAKAILLSATDSDGNTLAYSIVTPPTKGTLTGTPPNLSYRPNLNYFGSDSFTFRASDGQLASNLATVSISVTSINDGPVAQSQSVTTTKNTAVAITLHATDIDSSSLSYVIVSAPARGTLTGVAPNISYAPTGKYTGSDSFTFRVSDGVLTSTGTVSISILKRAPALASEMTASPIPATAGEPVTFVAVASDEDGDVLTYEWDFGDGTLSPESTHAYTTAGDYVAKVTVTDEDGLAITSSVTVPVRDQPIPPIALTITKAGGKSMARDTRYQYSITALLTNLPDIEPGTTIEVRVGELATTFTLNQTRTVKTASGFLALKVKTDPSTTGKTGLLKLTLSGSASDVSWLAIAQSNHIPVSIKINDSNYVCDLQVTPAKSGWRGVVR
jgi:hypothetical protein